MFVFLVVNLLTLQYIYMLIKELLLQDSVQPDKSCFNKYGQLSPVPPPLSQLSLLPEILHTNCSVSAAIHGYEDYQTLT